MSVDRGKTLIEGLVEYPLSTSADYIFYIVPSEATHGYGWSARKFFGQRRFYKNHRNKEVGSLEALIDVLHADVTQGGVQRIREIVIVTHANSQAMVEFPILKGPQSDPAQNFPYVNELTLALFQKLYRAGNFPTLRTKRMAVVAHLSDESWVTIRGCNFGNSRKGLYATYSFFGGRANVYAPRLFQHFGKYLLEQFARINTPEKLHEHLVRQHFLPKEMTPERKRSLVRDVYEPELFSEPHELASLDLGSPGGDERAKYEGLIDTLNSRHLSSALVAELATMMAGLNVPNWAPSDGAQIRVVKRDKAWSLLDDLMKDSVRYHIFYDISENVEAGEARLLVQARLAVDDGFSPRKPAKSVILQLFLDEQEDAALRGRICELAGYVEGAAEPGRQQFDAVRNLLKAGNLSDPSVPGIDLAAEINKNLEKPLAAGTKPVLISPNPWNDAAPRAKWKLEDATHRLLIKLENPSTAEGLQAHTVRVYDNSSPEERSEREMVYLADHVGNPDTPGTELAAYFDRFSLEDLASCVEYLRAPFKPGTSVYIHHAQQAIMRKKDFVQWMLARYPPDPNGPPLIFDAEWELTRTEQDDKSETSYDFDFNSVWAEVKASHPSPTTIQTDLFTEEDLAQVLKVDLDARVQDLESDTVDPEASPQDGFKAPFSKVPPVADKGLVEERDSGPVGCADFNQAIQRLIELQGTDPIEIEKILKTEKTESGTTLFDAAKSVLSKYSFVRRLGRLTEVMNLPWLPSSAESLVTEPIKRLLEYELKREITWWLSSEGVVVARTALLQTGLGILWAWGVIMVPAKMLKHIVEQWAEGDVKWKAVGHLTAMRQWLRAVATETYNASTVPDLQEINVSTTVAEIEGTDFFPFANEPYWLGRYFLEQYREYGRYDWLTWPGDEMKEGYDQGVMTAKLQIADELLRRAELGVRDALAHMDLNACKVDVLVRNGLLDLSRFHAQLVSALADGLLEQLPRI